MEQLSVVMATGNIDVNVSPSTRHTDTHGKVTAATTDRATSCLHRGLFHKHLRVMTVMLIPINANTRSMLLFIVQQFKNKSKRTWKCKIYC